MNYPLKDLDAHFTEHKGQRIGVMFRCPHCRLYAAGVYFNPVPPEFGNKSGWDRTGDRLETLTLTPSIAMIGHFHSWIRNGELCVDSPFSCTPLEPEHVI